MQSICQILQISEKELLTSAEDVEGRRAEQLARKYLRLIHNYRLIQFLLYGLTALFCFVANLAVQHTLDWFWIVLTAEAMAASLTLLPSYCDERWRGLGCLGSFTGSLLFLLAACCLYSGGTWFFVAAAWVLFAVGLLFLPYTLRRLPLPRPWAERKFSLYVGLETALVVAALGVNCLHDGGDWFFVAAAGTLMGVWLAFGWLVLRQLPLLGRRLLAYVAVGTGLLLLLLGAACLYGGGTWFFSAALWSVFGIAVVFLPLTIGQIPWPAVLLKQKALLYFSVISLLLLLGLALDGWGQWFPLPALPVALVCLALPWLWLGGLRYLPIGKWFRVGACLLATGLWAYLAPWVLDQALLAGGFITDNPYTLKLGADLLQWQNPTVITDNILLLIDLGFVLLALLCFAFGFWRRQKGK